MNKRRLLKLAKLLKADADNPRGIKFDLGVWGRPIMGGEPSVSCNTQACAMGLAALSGAFAADGLCWDVIWGDLHIEFHKGEQHRRGGISSAAALFGISTEQVAHLFVASSYPPAKQRGRAAELAVANRIRRLVASAA